MQESGLPVFRALASGLANDLFTRSGGIMGSVAIGPLNASSQATGNTTLVICRKAHVSGVCFGCRESEPYIASFKGLYTKIRSQGRQ
jgi:hypothetical protein